MAKLRGLNAAARMKDAYTETSSLLTNHVNEDMVKLTNVILRLRYEDDGGE
jgi:hypothetical protein